MYDNESVEKKTDSKSLNVKDVNCQGLDGTSFSRQLNLPSIWMLSTHATLRAKKSLTFFECDARNGWGARN